MISSTAYVEAAGGKVVRDNFFSAFLVLILLSLVALIFLLFHELVREGVGALSFNFITDRPRLAGREGGILPILVSTAMATGLALLFAIPISIGAALYLSEFTSATRGFGKSLRLALNVLAATPSIVFGLFGNAIFCVYFGLGYSILAGSLTLSCMVLPLLIPVFEEAFRAVPFELKQNSVALGFSRFRTARSVIIPTALPGIVAGAVLGFARAISETAALLFTSGYSLRMPDSVFDSGRVLSVHIYDLAMNVIGGETNAYASALILIITMMISGIIVTLFRKRLRRHL